jgi:hypothetical protein
MRKNRKQSQTRKSKTGRLIKNIGALVIGGLLLGQADNVIELEGAQLLLDIAGDVIEKLLDKTITIIELLGKLPQTE